MRFWPATDPAQLAYEHLREMALAGTPFIGTDAERFERGGLMALIGRRAQPTTPLMATIVEMPRPRWSPYEDPRLEALASAYSLLLAEIPDLSVKEAVI